MTRAEKSLNTLYDMAIAGRDIEGVQFAAWNCMEVKKELQRAAECEKLISPFPKAENPAIGRPTYKMLYEEAKEWNQRLGRTVKSDVAEIQALKVKAHGLIHALQIAKRDFKNWLHHGDAQEAAIAHIDKAIAAFEADETEGE